MADENTTYDVRLEDSLKELTELEKLLDELRNEQQKLNAETAEGTKAYKDFEKQIKAVNAGITKYQKQITDSIRLQSQQEAGLIKLRAQLSADTDKYSQLSDSMSDVAKADLLKQIVATTEEIENQQDVLYEHISCTGDYLDAIKGLESELDNLTDKFITMAESGTISIDAYNELSKVSERLKATQESVNAALSGIKPENEAQKLEVLKKAVEDISSIYDLWASASSLLGVENKELNSTISDIISVSSSLIAVYEALIDASKSEAVYRTANNIIQKLGINQTQAEVKALAAKNAMMSAGTVAQKAAAAATWLWNAALAANPVVLVAGAVAGLTVGIVALSNAFSSSAKATKASQKATEEYEKSSQATELSLNRIETNRVRISLDEETRGKKLISDLKRRGATKEEIAKAEFELAQDLRDIEITAAKERQEANMELLEAQEKAITAKEKEIATLGRNSKKYKEAKGELLEMKNAHEELSRKVAEDGAIISNTYAEMSDAAHEYNQTVSDTAYDAAMKNSEHMQKMLEADLEYQNTYQSESITSRLAYEAEKFRIQQEGEKERLDLQLQNNKISQEEYDMAMEEMASKARQFQADQTKDLNEYMAKSRQDIINITGQSMETQIEEATREYNEQLKLLDEIQPPNPEGMSPEEYKKQFAEYQRFMEEKEFYTEQLEKNLNKNIKKIKQDNAAELIEKVDENYAKELFLLQDNERARIELENKTLNEKIKILKEHGLETYELEAQQQTNNLALQQLNLNTALLNAEGNAKEQYKIKRKYLEAQLEASAGNADAIAQINKEIADLDASYTEERISKLEDFQNKANEYANTFNELWNAIEERKKEKIEKQYAEEEAILSDKLEKGLISQEQYDAQILKNEKQKNKELSKIERDKAIRDRLLASFNIAIDTAQGIMKTVSIAPLSGGLPWSAIVATIGATQLAALWAAPLPEAAKGMYINGPTHAEGGVRIEAEGGEAIINRRSTSMFLPLLSAINEAGGGIPFTTPGSDGGYAIRSSLRQNQTGFSASEMENALQSAISKLTVIATIEDIRREDANYMKIERMGTF